MNLEKFYQACNPSPLDLGSAEAMRSVYRTLTPILDAGMRSRTTASPTPPNASIHSQHYVDFDLRNRAVRGKTSFNP